MIVEIAIGIFLYFLIAGFVSEIKYDWSLFVVLFWPVSIVMLLGMVIAEKLEDLWDRNQR